MCPNRAAACADSHCLTAEKMPVLLSMSIPLRLDMKKMSASMAMTAIQEIMHAVLRWILPVTCGFSGFEALFAVGWEAFSLVIMHPSLAKTSPRAGGVRGRSRKVRGQGAAFAGLARQPFREHGSNAIEAMLAHKRDNGYAAYPW